MQGIRLTVFVLFATTGCVAGPVLNDNEVSNTVRIRTGDGGVIETQASEGSAVQEYGIAAPLSKAWAALPDVFEQMGFEPTRGDPRGRILGFENVRMRRIDGDRPSRYLDCGQGVTGANADSYDIYLSLLAQIVPSAEGSRLRVRTMATARNAAHGGVSVNCATNGRLEARVAEVLNAGLAGQG